MRASFVIIADDLTGALDSAICFAAAGAAVAVDIAALPETLAKAPEVVVINTDSRHCSPQEAMRRVWVGCEWLAPLRPGVVFKKIDSRLKGNPGPEADMVARCFGRSAALVAPAIPEIGRVVTDMHIHGFGIEVPLSITERLGRMAQTLSIPDCRSPGDMDAIAAALLADADDHIAVGASGLAAAIARNWGVEPRPAPLPALAQPEKAFLMVVGSRDPITERQIAALVAHIPETTLVEAPDGIVAPSSLPMRSDGPILVRAIAGGMAASPEEVAARLGDATRTLVERTGARTLLGCGGDTALAMVRALGIVTLRPERAPLPGCCVAAGEDRAGEHFRIVTKSGGFGDADTLVRLTEHVMGQKSHASVAANR